MRQPLQLSSSYEGGELADGSAMLQQSGLGWPAWLTPWLDLGQAQVALTAGTVLICTLSLWILSKALRKHANLSKEKEEEVYSLKLSRVGVYWVLALVQGSLTLSRIVLLPSQQIYVYFEDFSLFGTWFVHAVWLSFTWSDQGAAHLLPSSLMALAAGSAALAVDCLADVQTQPDRQDTGPDLAPTLWIVSVVCHSLLLVFLLGLMVVEMVMSGHVDAELAASHTIISSSMLKGEEMDAAGAVPDEKAAAEKAARKAAKKLLKPPKATRTAMAASSFKYVLPDRPGLRARLFGCFVFIAAERAVNLAVPILYKKMVDTLSQVSTVQSGAKAGQDSLLTLVLAAVVARVQSPADSSVHLVAGREGAGAAGGLLGEAGAGAGAGAGREVSAASLQAAFMDALQAVPFWHVFFPWVAAYLGCWYFRGGSGMEGLLASCRDILWAPITQAAYRRVNRDVFGHLLHLDHSFHVKRKTGQIMRILDRGTSAIQDTVSIVLFNVIPQMADIAVACTYLALYMEPWAAAIVAFTVAGYVPLTVWITERRGEVRKRMNALDNAKEARATDMLLNYETVKLFCAEQLELEGYDYATAQYQAAEYWQLAFLSLLAIAQGTCVWGGLVLGVVVCVKGVADGSQTVGDAVLFVTMMNQLYVPLTYFGSYYRQVQKALIDVENMFELLNTPPRVKDAPGAQPLHIVDGTLEFDRVVFGYGLLHPSLLNKNGQGATPVGLPPPQPVLKGISFRVQGGSTLAVVGSSGSGKSTLLRLICRFYDPWSGAVLIDGQDIGKATVSSVRRAVSVVPQDPVLFNQSIAYNIRYGVPGAADDEVIAAAQVSAIHNTICGFKKGYQTRVGERGLRLSGGEKQRVAFARAIVKKPAILILDEATSALDTLTEASIQQSLQSLRRKVTSVIVAHRLSTIMDADTILVMSEGQVVEHGSHAELLESGGLYAAMWSKQRSASDDSCNAEQLLDEVIQQQKEQQAACEQAGEQSSALVLPSMGKDVSLHGGPATEPSETPRLVNAGQHVTALGEAGASVNLWLTGSGPSGGAGGAAAAGTSPVTPRLSAGPPAAELRPAPGLTFKPPEMRSPPSVPLLHVSKLHASRPAAMRLLMPNEDPAASGCSSPAASTSTQLLSARTDYSRHPTPHRSRAAHDYDEDLAMRVALRNQPDEVSLDTGCGRSGNSSDGSGPGPEVLPRSKSLEEPVKSSGIESLGLNKAQVFRKQVSQGSANRKRSQTSHKGQPGPADLLTIPGSQDLTGFSPNLDATASGEVRVWMRENSVGMSEASSSKAADGGTSTAKGP